MNPNDNTEFLELDLFFNNSIFGAFFMMLDEPVYWNDTADKQEVMQYILHHMRITRVNQTFLHQYKTIEDDLIGSTPYDFFKHDIEQEIKLLTNIFNNTQFKSISREKTADGKDVYFEGDYVTLYDATGRITGVFGVQKDVTQRINAEEELKRSLKEKEVLLAEIHHRVKNNLAVINALLQLQIYDGVSESDEGKLNESIFRISTMAAIHELLYQSHDFSRLNVKEILHKITDQIFEMGNANHKDIQLDIQDTDVMLNMNQAIPCALIINEILTNAFNHAFKNKQCGKICVQAGRINFDQIELKISDDGIGNSVAINTENPSLGLKIIQILTDQLSGTFHFDSSEKGTTFLLTFSDHIEN